MKLLSLILLVCLMMIAPAGHAIDPSNHAFATEYYENIQRAVGYLAGHYVRDVGLIFESEDPTGPAGHWLKRTEYPSYHWLYNQTFWLYSDGLLSLYALSPWRSDIAEAISETYRKYNPPPSGKFEALFGIPVGPDRLARDVIVNQTKEFVVLYRIHDGPLGDPRIPYTDSIIYGALSAYYQGGTLTARSEVLRAASLWNGTCSVDYSIHQQELWPGNAPSDIGWCANMKLALTLYGAKVVGVKLPNFAELEAHLWSMQDPETGGIITLSNGHGVPSGSSNCETTALTLLLYNDALIERLSRQNTSAQPVHVTPPVHIRDNVPMTETVMPPQTLAYTVILLLVLIVTGVLIYSRRRFAPIC